jgi:5-formyltetrahydrofolate cyclo-ligase
MNQSMEIAGDLKFDKEYWRQQGRSARARLTPAWRCEASTALMRHLLALPVVARAQVIAPYASFGTEAATHGLITELLARGKTVVLPRVIHWRRALDLHVITQFPDGCEKGDFGILEPTPERCPTVLPAAEIDLFFVPGLIFDRTHHRIGYGGGYYDRILGQTHRARTIGLAFSAQIIDAFERQPWDRPVDAICTEKGLLPGDRLE